MKCFLSGFLPPNLTPSVCLIVLMFVPTMPAQRMFAGRVQSALNSTPIPHTNVGIHNFGSNATTDNGDFAIADPGSKLKVGYLYTFYVEGWVITDPYVHERGQTYLPDPAAGEILLKVLQRGDAHLLADDSIKHIVIDKTSRISPKIGAPDSSSKPHQTPVPDLPKPSGRMGSLAVPEDLRPTKGLQPRSLTVVSTKWDSNLDSSYQHMVLVAQEGNEQATLPPEISGSADSFFAEQSRQTGIPEEKLATAVQNWSSRAVDPYQRGLVALNEKKYFEASALIRESIKVSQDDLPNKQLSLASSEYHQGNYKTAEDIYRNLLAATPHDAVVLQYLATTLAEDGRYSEAEPIYERAIAIFEQESKEQFNEDLVDARANLGLLYSLQGYYSKALPLFEDALAELQDAHGPNYGPVATLLDRIGVIFEHQSRYDDAISMFDRALSAAEQAYGPDDPHVATILDNLGHVYADEGRFGKAIPLYQRARTIFQRKLGPDHPYVATVANDLGVAYVRKNDLFLAELFFKNALDIDERRLDPTHINTATSLWNLGSLYNREHRYAEAEPILKRAFKAYETEFGTESPRIVPVGLELSTTLDKLGQKLESHTLRERMTSIRGREH